MIHDSIHHFPMTDASNWEITNSSWETCLWIAGQCLSLCKSFMA